MEAFSIDIKAWTKNVLETVYGKKQLHVVQL